MSLCERQTLDHATEFLVLLKATARTACAVVRVVVHILSDLFAQGLCESLNHRLLPPRG